jgi:hypothetical protein
MTQYLVLSAASAALLQTAVNAKLALGWVTAGGVFVNSDASLFYQAVTQ